MSNPGGRSVNEDYVGACERDGEVLLALADGLGGHGAGEVASKLVVSKALEVFKTNSDSKKSGHDIISHCFTESQDNLLAEQLRLGKSGDMKTTLVLLHFIDNTATWGHIGDSRLYVFDGLDVSYQTKDHSVPQMLVLTGEIREKDIRNHPDRNRLLRVMGVEWESPRYELSTPIEVSPGMSFLLCSDGFWELIVEKDMCRELKKASSPKDWLESMEKIVLKNGRRKNMDNYSAVAAFVR